MATNIKKYMTSEEAYNLSEGTDDCTYYVGATADIKAMYKSIARNKNTEISPMFCDAPKFSQQKQVYALCIDKDNWLTVVNSDTMLLLILEGDVTPC